MTRAGRDPNRVTSIIGVSSSTTGSYTQDKTPVAVRANPTNKRLHVDIDQTSFFKLVPKTAFGELLTGELSPIFQLSFEYTVSNTKLTTNTVVAGGTITQADGMAVCTTSTTTGSHAHFHIKRRAKYRAGFGGLMRFTALFTTPVAGTLQYAALAAAHGSTAEFVNGLSVGYTGTVFGFQRWQNDVLVEDIAQSAWDDPMDGTGASGMTLDQTKLNVYQIRFQHLGAGAIQLLIESDTTGQFVLAHTIHYANKNITPSSYNPNYTFMLHVDNKATTSNIIMKCASAAYFIEGRTELIELQQVQFSSGSKQKTTVTSDIGIFTIRNKSTYAGKTNYIDIHVGALMSAIEASSPNNLGGTRLVKNATLGGSPSWADINTTDSVVEIDTAATTITGGTELLLNPLAGKNDKIIRDLSRLEIIISPGETLTIAGNSANSATINAGMLWKELF